MAMAIQIWGKDTKIMLIEFFSISYPSWDNILLQKYWSS